MKRIIPILKSVIGWTKKSYRPEFDEMSRDHLAKLLDGYIHLVHGYGTTQAFNAALIAAYIKTNGRFQDYVHEVETNGQNTSQLADELIVEIQNNLGTRFASTSEIKNSYHPRVSEHITLERDGYELMPFIISEKIIDSLCEATVNFEYRIKKNDEQVESGNYLSTLSDNVVTAFALPDQLINNSTVQDLFLDSKILKAVRRYLGCPQIRLRDVNLWFSRPQAHASSESAQFYHFDQASIKWVKVFIFLNDVDQTNGPHCAILGSHLPGSKPLKLLKRGYARIPDEDIIRAYGLEKERQFIVSKGAVLLADTNAWHKGSSVKEGHRLVLEFEYTACVEQDFSIKKSS